MADKIVVQTLVSGTEATCVCQGCGRAYREEIYLTSTEFTPVCRCLSCAPLVQFRRRPDPDPVPLTDSERRRDDNNNPIEND